MAQATGAPVVLKFSPNPWKKRSRSIGGGETVGEIHLSRNGLLPARSILLGGLVLLASSSLERVQLGVSVSGDINAASNVPREF